MSKQKKDGDWAQENITGVFNRRSAPIISRMNPFLAQENITGVFSTACLLL
jgi:hypothetical protein